MNPRICSLWIAAAAIGLSTTSQAQEAELQSCPAADADCGARAFARGTSSFDAGDYASAEKWFSIAAQADPHPVVLFNQALSEARLRKFTSAVARFRVVLEHPDLDPVVRARVERELSAAEARQARVSIEGPRSGEASVFLDGESVTPSGDEIRMDPGSHHVKVELGSEVVYDQQLELTEGERVRLRVSGRTRAIDVVVVPGSTPKPPPPPAPAPPARPPPRSGLPPVVFYAAAAGTLAVAGVTVWSGLDVNRAHEDYRADLPRLSQAEADQRVEDGHDRELRTNLLLGGTLVLAAGTAVLGLVLVDWSGMERSMQTSVVLTPLGGGVTGRF